MKYLSLAASLALVILAASACIAQSTPAPDLEATVQAAVKATLDARPTNVPAPDIEATVVAAVEATLAAHQNAPAQPASTPSTDVQPAGDAERPHRSYPAPTGLPGFRKYYQKRCYPGCHYDASDGTPTPQASHP